MNHKSELKDRIEARKKELESKLSELKADTKGEVREKIDYIGKELKNLKDILSDGWDNVNEKISQKLNEWLKKNK